MDKDVDRLITRKEFAVLLSMPLSSFDRARDRGDIPRPVRIDSRPRWRLSDAQKFIQSLRPSK